jgi:hypothetical protein
LFFITALDSLKPEGGECFQPWTVLNNEPPVALLTGQIGEPRQILYAAVLEDGRIIRPTPVSGASQAIRTVAVSKSGQGVGEQKQTALKVRKSHRQHVPPAKKDS